MTTPTFSSRALAVLFLVGLAGLALFSMLSGMPAGDVHLLPCPVHSATGVSCPGCGMTRACLALARGELGNAWSLHPFAFFLVPLAAVLVLWPRGSRRAWSRVPSPLRSAAVGLTLCAVLGLWIARLA